LLVARMASAQLAPTSPDALVISDTKIIPFVEVRTRGEYRRDSPELGGTDGFGRDSGRVRDAWGVFERTRAGVTAERDILVARVTLEDARAWGVPFPTATLAPPSSSTAGSFGAHEAYLELRSNAARPSFLRLGRQVIQWGEGALIGGADWSPTGRSFDAIRGRASFGSFGAEAFAAILEPSSPLGVSAGETAGPVHSGVDLFGLEADAAVAQLFKLEVYGFAKIARSDGAELDGSRFQAVRASGELYAAGVRAFGDGHGFSYSAEGTYEVGTASAISPNDVGINAFAAHGHIGKKFDDVALTPTVRIGGAFATGDDGSGTYKQFDPLFADPHQYGMMDVFSLSNHIEGNATASIVPMTDMMIAGEYRYARLETTQGEWLDSYLSPIGTLVGSSVTSTTVTNFSTATPSLSKELGHEMSVLVSYRPWRGLDLSSGYDLFLFGDGARTVMAAQHRGLMVGPNLYSPANFAQFVYLQATLRLP
jgi:hypothetical protein